MKISNITIILLLVIISTYLLTYLRTIGLHGDEAFMGLDGIYILNNGIPKPYGMNKYTGTLQALLNAVSFKLWKIDIAAIRIGGVLCNIIAMLLIIKVLKDRVSNNAAIIFLVLFAQSVFLLCYSKVAWEVCTFNYILFALSLYSIHKLENEEQKGKVFYVFLFLFASLTGSYNHIIFSSAVVAMVSSVILYLFLNQVQPSDFDIRCLSLASISILNIIFLHHIMNHYIDLIWNKTDYLTFIFPIFIIVLEVILFNRIVHLIGILTKYLFKVSFSIKIVKIIILAIPLLFFIKIHFLKFFHILSNEILLLRLFSYPPSPFLKWAFIIGASTILIIALYYLIVDILKKDTNFLTYFIIIYFGVLCIYTQGMSIRYFHLLTIFLFLYLSKNLIFKKRVLPLIAVILISINAVIVQFTLWHLNFNTDRQVQAMRFKMDCKHYETSAHFLNFSPVIDFIKKNEIGEIKTKDNFFIGNVFKFYKNVYPEIEDYKNAATVDYDYENKGIGFKIE